MELLFTILVLFSPLFSFSKSAVINEESAIFVQTLNQVNQIISKISDCHFHIVFDTLAPINSKIIKPITISQPNQFEFSNSNEEDLKIYPQFNALKTRGVNCIYMIIYIAEPSIKGIKSYQQSSSWFCRRLFLDTNHFHRECKYVYHLFITHGNVEIWKSSFTADSALVYSKFALRIISEEGDKNSTNTRLNNLFSFYLTGMGINNYFSSNVHFIPMPVDFQKDLQMFLKFSTQFYCNEWEFRSERATSRVFNIQGREDLDQKRYNKFWDNNGRSYFLNYYDKTDLDVSSIVLNILGYYTNSTIVLKAKAGGSWFWGKLRSKSVISLNPNEVHNPSETISSRTKTFTFLTCYSEPKLSFAFYIQPFQFEMWIGLFVQLIILKIVLDLYIYKYHPNCKVSSFMYLLSTLFEEGVSIHSSIEKSTFFRIVFGLWFLLAVIFTQSYLGLVITELSSSLPTKSVHEFKDLVKHVCNPKCKNIRDYTNQLDNNIWDERPFDKDRDFKIITPIKKNNEYENKLLIRFRGLATNDLSELIESAKNFKTQETLYKSLKDSCKYDQGITDGIFPCNMSLSENGYGPIENIRKRGTPDTKTGLLPSQLLFNRNYPIELAIEQDLVKCDKIVYADWFEFVNREYEYLSKNYHWHKFHLAKDRIFSTTEQWTFSESGGSKIPLYFKCIFESGIFNKLHEYFTYNVPFWRKEYTMNVTQNVSRIRVKSMKLHGSIQTTFIIYAGLIVFTQSIFGIEIFYLNRIHIKMFFYRLLKFILATGSKIFCFFRKTFFSSGFFITRVK